MPQIQSVFQYDILLYILSESSANDGPHPPPLFRAPNSSQRFPPPAHSGIPNSEPSQVMPPNEMGILSMSARGRMTGSQRFPSMRPRGPRPQYSQSPMAVSIIFCFSL